MSKPFGKLKSGAAKRANRPGKQKGRRNVLKSHAPINANRFILENATVVSRNWVVRNGEYFQVGDVIGFEDEQDGLQYFAVIRALFVDQTANDEASCIVQWLVPREGRSVDGNGDNSSRSEATRRLFSAADYELGPRECVARSLDFAQFVARCPLSRFDGNAAPRDGGLIGDRSVI